MTPDTVSFKVENEPVTKTFRHLSEFKLYGQDFKLLVVLGEKCGIERCQVWRIMYLTNILKVSDI